MSAYTRVPATLLPIAIIVMPRMSSDKLESDLSSWMALMIRLMIRYIQVKLPTRVATRNKPSGAGLYDFEGLNAASVMLTTIPTAVTMNQSGMSRR